MKNILKQYLDKEGELLEEPKTKKKLKKVRQTNEIIEVVDMVLITEDGRQILNG